MLERMGCRVGLFFTEGIKGTKRRIWRLTGGVIAFGNMELPVPVHGKAGFQALQVNKNRGTKLLPIQEVFRAEISVCRRPKLA